MERKQESSGNTIVTCILGIVFIYLLARAIRDWKTLDLGIAKFEMDDTRRQAVDLYLGYLRSLGATALALIGSLWAFGIFTRGTMEITGHTRWGIFILTNLVLASSYVTYFFGEDLVVGMMFDHGYIDLGASQVLFWADLQRHLFLLGVSCLVATTVICRRSREGQ